MAVLDLQQCLLQPQACMCLFCLYVARGSMKLRGHRARHRRRSCRVWMVPSCAHRARLFNNNETLQEQPLIVVCEHQSDEGLPLHLLPAESAVTLWVLGLSAAWPAIIVPSSPCWCADVAGGAALFRHLQTVKTLSCQLRTETMIQSPTMQGAGPTTLETNAANHHCNRGEGAAEKNTTFGRKV